MPATSSIGPDVERDPQITGTAVTLLPFSTHLYFSMGLGSGRLLIHAEASVCLCYFSTLSRDTPLGGTGTKRLVTLSGRRNKEPLGGP